MREILAVRRGEGWRFDPDTDLEIAAGDTLLVRGPPAGVDHLRAVAGGGDGLE